MTDTSKQMTTRAVAIATLVLSGLQLMVVLDGTVANLALAPLQAELGLSDSGRNWVLTAYALAFGGLMLLGGRLGDSYGRKKMFIAGVGVFTLASLLCGIASNDVMLIGARACRAWVQPWRHRRPSPWWRRRSRRVLPATGRSRCSRR